MSVPGGITAVWLTARQWDEVRDALYRRGTKTAHRLAGRIWEEGGGTDAPKVER